MATLIAPHEIIARWKSARLGVWILLMVSAVGCGAFAGASPTPFVVATSPPLPPTVQLPTPLASATVSATARTPATITAPPPTAIQPPGTPARRRIQFQPGGTTATVQGATATPGDDQFALRALAGQTMQVSVSSSQGPVILIIYGADGNVLISDHAGASTWRGTLPTTEDYFIDTRSVASNVIPFTLQVTIPPK